MNLEKRKQFESLPEISEDPKYNDEIKIDFNKLNESTFKHIIKYYDSISPSPIEYLITATVTALSGAVGKNAFINITDSLTIYLNVWSVLIGPSSVMRKTTAINECKKELQRINDTAYNEYKNLYASYCSELEEAKSNKIKFEKPIPLRKYFIFPNDSTIESLTDILSYSDKGLLVHSEFGSLLAQLNRSYSGDSKQFLTHIYDVPDTYEVSRATKNNILIQKPFLSILAASTIDWVKENSSPSDLRTGFLARFLYSIRNKPDEHKGIIPLLKLRERTSHSPYYINVREIYDYLTSIEPGEISICKEAIELHCSYDIESYYEMLQTTNENEASFKARLVIYCLKFAALIALTDKRMMISKDDMEDSILLTDYFKKNVERLLNNEISLTEFTRHEKKIIDLLKNKKGKCKHSTLLQLSNLKAKDFNEVINNLSEKELVEIVTERNNYNKSVKLYKLKSK
jgi:predicted transcriptional regulator